MKLKLAVLGAATVMLVGLGATAPAVSAAPAAAAEDVQPLSHGTCTSTVVVRKSSTTYIRLPATSSGSTHCTLSQGNQGAGVRALQRALVNCYKWDTGGIDGIFGDKTRRGVRHAQSQSGAEVDGIYGPETRDKINWPRFRYSNGSFTGYCAKR